jgi:hypothetical protein
MALITASWTFAVGAPGLDAVADALSRQLGLPVVRASTADERLEVPMLRESLFDWTFVANSIEVFSFAPVHPFLWENLDEAMQALGGQLAMQAPYWRPDPRYRSLRKAWADLSSRQQLILRLPALGMSRPLDRLAR